MRYWCFGSTIDRQTEYKEVHTMQEVDEVLGEKRIVFVTLTQEMDDDLLRDGPYCTIERERMYMLGSHNTPIGVYLSLNPTLLLAHEYLVEHEESE